jgi:hypothetical protein
MGAELKGLWLAEIKGEIRAEATKSWTSELGVVTSGKMLPGKTVYGKCGIMKENPTPVIRDYVRPSRCAQPPAGRIRPGARGVLGRIACAPT